MEAQKAFVVMKRKIQILKKSIFPTHNFFTHLLKGTQYYQNSNFERAAEEWAAARWIKYDEPIQLKRLDGRIFCGGHIHDVPFLFFLYAIFTNNASGVGAIKTNGVAKNLIFNKGRLVRAGTTRREERIGNYILKRGNFTSEKMTLLLNDAREQGKRIGRYLVERGLLAEDTLSEILSLQVEEIISDIFFWQTGHFYFLEKQIIRETVVNYDPLNIARIAAQREFNFKDFRNKIPTNKIIFRPSPYAAGNKEEILNGLNVNHQFIFSLIDGARNIEQLIKFSGTDEVSVIHILYQLNAAGLIRQTKEVAEYEDKEFSEISKILEVFFEVYKIIYNQIFYELGIFALNLVRRSRNNLKNSYRNLFTDVPLDTPERLNLSTILRNIARHYPNSNEKAMFIDAFAALFDNLIGELERYLGRRLSAETAEQIRVRSSNIVRFAEDTDLKMRLLGVLNRITR
jgi:hypothetical protein